MKHLLRLEVPLDGAAPRRLLLDGKELPCVAHVALEVGVTGMPEATVTLLCPVEFEGDYEVTLKEQHLSMQCPDCRAKWVAKRHG